MTAQPTLTATETAFHVEGYEKIDYSLLYVDGAFAAENTEIADSYRPYGRCLMVVDETVAEPPRRRDARPTSTTTASTSRSSPSRSTRRTRRCARWSASSTRSATSAWCAPSRCSSSAAA